MTALSDFDGPPPGGDGSDALARARLDLNDVGNGKRLAIGLRDDALYVEGVGWLVWDGARFSAVAGSERMRARAAETLARMLEEEAAALSRQPVPKAQIDAWMADKGEGDPDAAERKIRAERKQARTRFALSCGNMSKVRSAMEAAAAAFLVRLDELDADRGLLQLPNGTLDLAAIAEVPESEDEDERRQRWGRALLAHDRASRPSRVCGTAFDPEAAAPEWARFIALVMPDPEMRRYLQVLCGLTLAGQEDERALFFLGKGGNGKSTVVKALTHVLGDYAQPCRIEMFCEQRNASMGTTPEEAVLPGARLYPAAEPDANVTLSASKMKGLTGGDVRQANPKNKAVFPYRPVGLPLLQMNAMANVNDPSEGFWRRVFPVPFEQQLADLHPSERRSSAAMERIIRVEGPGILNWLLEGWAIYRAEGVRVPARAAALKGALQALSDPVGQFLADRTERRTGAEVRTAELHKAFIAWSEDQGMKAMGARAFKRQMLALDYAEKKSTGGHWYWIGLDLLDGGGGGSPYTPVDPGARHGDAAARYRSEFE